MSHNTPTQSEMEEGVKLLKLFRAEQKSLGFQNICHCKWCTLCMARALKKYSGGGNHPKGK